MTATDGKVSCGRFPSTTVTYNNYTIPFQRRKTKQEKIWTMKVDLNQVSQKRLPQLLVLLSIYRYMHTFLYIYIYAVCIYAVGRNTANVFSSSSTAQVFNE